VQWSDGVSERMHVCAHVSIKVEACRHATSCRDTRKQVIVSCFQYGCVESKITRVVLLQLCRFISGRVERCSSGTPIEASQEERRVAFIMQPDQEDFNLAGSDNVLRESYISP
jgi:hypothetical protein